MSDPFDDLLNEAVNLQQTKKNKTKAPVVQNNSQTPDHAVFKPKAQTFEPLWIPKALSILVHEAACTGCGTIHSTPDRFTYIVFDSEKVGKHVEVYDPELHAGLKNLPLTLEKHSYSVSRCQDCAVFGELQLVSCEDNVVSLDFDKKREA